jgi:hypothetical protein
VRFDDLGRMPSREATLELAAELRKDRRTNALPDDSGHLGFIMPEADFYFWVWRYPELASHDAETNKRAWLKFLASDEGRKYCVNPRDFRPAPLRRGVIVR